MKDEDKLRILLGLEKAEAKVSQADALLGETKAEMRSAIISSIGLDPTVNELDNLKAQVATAILLVMQADKIVKSTEAIVSKAHEAVEIARMMHITAARNRET